MGWIMDAVRGPRCDMCGRRVDAVFIAEKGSSLKVCAKCKKSLRASDRSAPHGHSAAGYRAGSGQPPKLAGPMGSKYRGPAPRDQQRR
jgi:ribosome-binding protein aMBF1 (putative translation factor)